MLRLIIALWLMAGGFTLHAQTVVQKPSNPGSWKIAYAPAQASASPFPVARLAEVTYTISGPVALVESRFDNNTTKTAYIVGSEEFSRNSKTGQIRWIKAGEYSLPDSRCTEVFPGFEWVEDRYLVGKEKVGNVPCLHFRLAADDGSAPQEAWVTEAERRPVAFVRNFMRGTYIFLEGPKTPLEVPQEFLDYRDSLRRKPL